VEIKGWESESCSLQKQRGEERGLSYSPEEMGSSSPDCGSSSEHGRRRSPPVRERRREDCSSVERTGVGSAAEKMMPGLRRGRGRVF
jgi:hypothetical protein